MPKHGLLNKCTVLFFLLVAAVITQAQVTIVFNPAARGGYLKGLSLIQILNNSAENYVGSLQVEVKSLSGSGSFLQMLVPSVSIMRGNNVVPAARFAAATTTYGTNEEGNYTRQTGMMPEGELEYCFKLVVTHKDRPNEVFENCYVTTNTLSSPMRLVAPVDGDQFCEKRPRFSWQPPLPLPPGARFHIKLVNMKEGQSQAEALLVNNPVFYQTNINGFVMPYPLGVPDLKEGETYVWQVSAVTKGVQSLSEVWTFTVACEKPDSSKASYRELKAADDGGYLHTGNTLRFAVYNAYQETNLQYRITDLSDPAKMIKNTPVLRLHKGANNLSIDLRKIPGLESDSEYMLNVVLPNGKKVAVRFKYDDRD